MLHKDKQLHAQAYEVQLAEAGMAFLAVGAKEEVKSGAVVWWAQLNLGAEWQEFPLL